MVNVSLTEQERDVLVQLIDIAVKNSGLNVAEAGVVLAKKLGALGVPKEEAKEEKEEEVVSE